MTEVSVLPVARETQELAPITRLSVGQVVSHVRLIQEVMQSVMKKDTHYGIIPGCDKPSLWKPGAELLCVTFRIAPSYQLEELSTGDEVRYRVRCIGTHQGTGVIIGEGLGECSTNEEKYKWRRAASNSEFENTPEDRRRIKYGYSRRDKSEYQIKQVRTERTDLANTALKMAAKRAQVAMAINAVGASDIFAQDLEDLPEEYLNQEQEQKPPVQQPRAKAEPAKADSKPAAPENTGPITEGMKRVITAKLTAAALSEADLFKKFGVESWTGFKASQANSIMDFIKNPAS